MWPQVDGHRQGHRQLPAAALPALLGQDGLDEHRREVLRHRGAVALGHRPEPVQRDQAHGDVEGIEGLRGAGVLVGLALPHTPADPGFGISEVGVLLLLLRRRLVHVQDAAGVGDLVAQLPEIDRQQGAEQGQSPRPVGQGVEDLQGDAVSVVKEADEPAVVLLETHRLAGVAHVLLHEGAGGVVGLKVIPEKAPADVDPEAGEPGHGLVDGPLESVRVHHVRHHRRKAVDGGVVLLLDGGIHHGGVVQTVPLIFLFSGHDHAPLPCRRVGCRPAPAFGSHYTIPRPGAQVPRPCNPGRYPVR